MLRAEPGGRGLNHPCARAAVGAVVGDPRLRLRARCWSAEIIFSNIGARMLDFLEQFPCVLWVCACGFSPSSRELLTRHLRTFLCVALLWADFFFFFQISTGGARGPRSPPGTGGSLEQGEPQSSHPAALHSLEVCRDADKGSCDRGDDNVAKRSRAPFCFCPFACKIPFPAHGSFPEKSLMRCYRYPQCFTMRRESWTVRVQIIGSQKLPGFCLKASPFWMPFGTVSLKSTERY